MNIQFFLLCYSIAYTFDKREVAADRRVGAAHKRGSTKEAAVYRRDRAAQSSSAKQVARHPTGGAALKSPAKIAPPRRGRAAPKSSSTKKVANYRNGGAAQKRGSAQVNSSTKKVANYRRSGAAQGSSAKKVANYHRNEGAQKSVSAKDIGSKVQGPIPNFSKTPKISSKTEKTSQRPRGPKATLNPKGAKKMLKRPQFTRKELLEESKPVASTKPVRFKIPTRIGRLGNKEIVRPKTTPLPPLHGSKNILRDSWDPSWNYDVKDLCISLMTQIIYSAQGNYIERVERVAAKYRGDTRYRMAFLILTLNELANEMHRRQNFLEYRLVVWRNYQNYYWFYNVYKVINFYADMLRRNIDITYGIEYVLRLYAEKSAEREAISEAKYARKKERADLKAGLPGAG